MKKPVFRYNPFKKKNEVHHMTESFSVLTLHVDYGDGVLIPVTDEMFEELTKESEAIQRAETQKSVRDKLDPNF